MLLSGIEDQIILLTPNNPRDTISQDELESSERFRKFVEGLIVKKL